jgi:hypothetical protein
MDALTQLQAVDAATLTPFVRRALDRETASLGDWQVAPFGGSGRQGAYRFVGSALDDGQILPWSLVLKVVPPAAATDSPSGSSYGKREFLAYQSGLLADLPGGLKAPGCLGVTEQPWGDDWLWLEEVTDLLPRPWPPEQYPAVARQLGTFSAAWLTGRPLPAHPWLSQSWYRSKVAEAASVITELPALLDHPLLRPALPDDTARRVLRLWDEREAFCIALDQLPQTFCHLDAFPRNLLLRPTTAGTHEIVAIDWEFAGVNAVGADIAQLVGGSLLFREVEIASANELEQAVFQSYLEGLREAGWQGDQQQVRLGYAAGLVLHYVFLLLGALQEGTRSADVRQWIEETLNRPYIQVLEESAVFFAFLVARGDEARQLLHTP